jgi:hypothetical protein
MPATRARSTAPRFDSLKPTPTPSPSRGTRRKFRTESLSPSSDDCESIMPTLPLTVKRKDTQQQKQKRPQTKPATDSNEIIEISDDDDDELPRRSNPQTSMIADFRRQINKLREVSGISVQVQCCNLLTRASGGSLSSGKCQAQERSRASCSGAQHPSRRKSTIASPSKARYSSGELNFF